MSKIIVELADEDLMQFGETKIKEEIEQTFRWLRMKGLLKGISHSLSGLEKDYEGEVEDIKKEAWMEYKKDISL